MKYSKKQKFLSSLVIFSLLFGTTVRIPMMNFFAFAGNSDFYNLVGIIVEEEKYNKIDSEVERYAEDIQANLENTKVVIIPTPKDTPAFKVASTLESLYFEGYKSLKDVDFESKLVGTVIIGNIKLPEVYLDGNSAKTIVPYTDFEDKKYIYNHESSRYEENSKNINGIKSEIWHGVISSNTGEEDDDIDAIKDYFDKNHDYYKGTGNFNFSDGILNGNKNQGLNSSYEPIVFYYDSFRENQSLNYDNFIAYKGYINNIEDIIFNRYTKTISDKIKAEILGNQNKEIEELISKLDSPIDPSSYKNSLDTSSAPDIQTKEVINNLIKRFIQIFSQGTISDFIENVQNAGRYNKDDNKVNVDLIPNIITKIDDSNGEILKDGILELEKKIDELVKNNLQEDVYIPIRIEHNRILDDVYTYGCGETDCVGHDYIKYHDNYINFLYGKQITSINKAEECSIFKGSTFNNGQLIEANRGYNVEYFQTGATNSKSDYQILQDESNYCANKDNVKSGLTLNGYWGGNTPLNLDFTNGIGELKVHNVKKSITPIFDIKGTNLIDNSLSYPSNTVSKNGSSYEDCLQNNFLISRLWHYHDNSSASRGSYTYYDTYRLPINGQTAKNWSCSTISPDVTYTKTYDQLKTEGKCVDNICNDGVYTIYYKNISSIVSHKSPTSEELVAQTNNMVTKYLPVDRDRYIDYKGKGNLGYQKINYPYLFRLGVEDGQELSIENIDKSFKKFLDSNSNILGESLYDYLKNKPDVNISGKTSKYYDSLVFGIYWNNLDVAGKYKFVFENYLSDQLGGNDYDFSLIENKKQYEVAYLGANGDSSNMYILLDPNSKDINPYADIISKNQELNNTLLGYNSSQNNSTTNSESIFKCGSIEGIPIWEWLPAVNCRLKSLLPPTIKITGGQCGGKTIGLSNEDEKSLFENGGDTNKNGVIDCHEEKLNGGKIELKTDTSKFYYNSLGKLQANIKDKDGNLITLDSTSKIKYELQKIIIPENDNYEISSSNKKIIYDINNSGLNNSKIIKDYINFENGEIKSNFGKGEKSFKTKSKNANVVFKAYLTTYDNNNQALFNKESEPIEIQIRGDKLFLETKKIIDNNGKYNLETGINTVKVSDKTNIFITNYKNISFNDNDIKNLGKITQSKEKLFLNLTNIDKNGNLINLAYPINIEIFSNKENLLIENIEINNDNYNIKELLSIKEAGTYLFTFKDKNGYSITKEIVLLPDNPTKIDFSLGTNVIETGGSVTTNLLTIYDKYNNIVSGNLYNIDLEIDGDGLLFNDNKKDEIKYSTFEGYSIFNLISTNDKDENILKYSLKDSSGNLLLDGKEQINTKNKINLVVKSIQSNIKIGGDKYLYELTYRDENGNLLSSFNSRVYFYIPKVYGEPTKSYFEVKNGKAIIEFNTTTVAGENIQVEFQTEGLKNITKKNIIILPEKAIKMDMSFSQSKIEANSSNFSNVKIDLKDRYGNLVFNDNSRNLKIDILDKYKGVITPEKGKVIVNKGTGTFKIGATNTPGIAYFKISTQPSLENNSFKIGDNIIKGVGETAGKLETYYFWNKDKIIGRKYNSIYTTLIGSNYGDINQKDYLAGSILFDGNNRALGITSLLNSPYKTNDILNIIPNGNVENIYNDSDLSQDIEKSISFKNNKVLLNLFNSSLNTFIGNIYYNFDNNTKLKVCNLENQKCELDDKNSSIFLKSLNNGFSSKIDNNNLIINDISGNKILSINNNGEFTRYGNIQFQIDNTNKSNSLLLDIYLNGEIIGKLGFNFIKPIINVSRDETVFENKINSLKNSILILIKSSSYSSRDNLEGKIIYYNDPFSSTNDINDFSSGNSDGYENFINKGGLGWSEGNKTLLSFTSGKSIGESVKDYMSFSVINLGDPVVKLKNIKEKIPGTTQNRNFDSTIGKLLTNEDDIDSYEIFDYNKDEREDILVIKNDGTLKLFENKKIENNFIDKGNLAYIVDIGTKKSIKTGDFTGDGYNDIFFINNNGEPFLLNNYEKDFYRIPLKEQFNLEGRIIYVEKFDMDNDSIDDIVTLDDNGSINIFYGGGNNNNPKFTKNNIYNGYGVSLNSDIRNDNGLVYFNGLYQIDKSGYNEDLLKDNQEYINKFNENLKNLQSNPESSSNVPNNNSSIQTEQLDNLIFEELVYGKKEEKTNINIDNLENYYDNNQEYTNNNNVTFIKSNYSKNVGLKVEKKYIDKNGGFLKYKDIIEVEIILTNTSGNTLNNIAYGEKIDDIFELLNESIKSSKKVNIDYETPNVKFLIDDFSLASGESLKINYNLETRAIQYGVLKVGLFEGGEIGDDKFGDIILKNNDENCGKTLDIFRSLSNKTYQKGIKTQNISSDKQKLPDEIEQNNKDENGNGIPDYIDNLTNTENLTPESDLTFLQDYSKNALNDFNNTDEYNDNLSLNEKISNALDNVDEIAKNLSCNTAGCISSPMNWAPLAPGGDPTFLGFPVGDGLKVGEGLPIFSMMTNVVTPFGCYPISVWPASPLADACAGLGAGGYLSQSPMGNMSSPFNFLRIFITPTLTGAMGTAICFGPSGIAGRLPPPGIWPLVLGGNCIVTVKNLIKVCNNDGSDGDVASIGQPDISGDNFSLINGNCSSQNSSTNSSIQEINDSLFEDYYNYKLTKNISNGLSSGLESFYEGIKNSQNILNSSGNSGLFSSNGVGDTEIKLSLDFSSIKKGNFSDILKITKTSISSFPGFLMNWVTRQIEEILTKLTDFPSVFIILPDFSGIFNGSWTKTSSNWAKNSGNNKEISNNINISKDILNSNNSGVQTVNSGIKNVYNFLAQVPLINIEKETVNINIPWIDRNTIDKQWESRKNSLKQREKEFDTKTESRKKAFGSTFNVCNYTDDKKQAECEKYNKVVVQAEGLISSLEKNIEVLEDYKKFPEKINNLLDFKERYLEQILCNIESISKITGGRISKNGKRFKAWVETYILIKAILKSWQLFVDIFLDYETECNTCKNERGDLMTWIWSLISSIIPKIPVIQFPKWPDIIIDLHNIRAGINVVLPEFNISDRPILLPDLPTLTLPDIPSININLPQLPVLPTIELPELPDLPSLPSVELPELPPPPKLPKILASFEGILDILKLVTKLMCIIRSLPFVPESVAGDHIAFLTERYGYLNLDFLFGINYPQFSYPFIDAIKVTSYVNLEMENDYIVELANQAATSVNNFSNNLVPQLNIEFEDINIDIPNLPDSIDVNIDSNVGYKNTKNNLQLLYATILIKNLQKLSKYINDNKNDLVDNNEFKKLVNKSLSSKEVISNPRMDEIRELWNTVNKYSYSKEDKIIKDLQQDNKEKFNKLKDVVNTEIIKNKKLKDEFKIFLENKPIKVSSNNLGVDVDFYNKQFKEYNNKFKESVSKLYNYKNDEKTELKNIKNEVINKINNGIESSCTFSSKNNNLLAANTSNSNLSSGTSSQTTYTYKGIYVIENGISYYLTDYLDEMTGEEEVNIIDYDKDGDEDLMYILNGQIYIKENLKEKNEKVYVSENPIIIDSKNNKFYNGNTFYEAVNNFEIAGAENGAINATFLESTRNQKLNYRIEFFSLVDKALNIEDQNYYPKGIKKTIIDAFSPLDNQKYIITETKNYTLRKNLGQIKSVGNLKGAKLHTYEFKNIKNDLADNKIVNISIGTKLYSGNESFNITYIEDGNNEEKSLHVFKNSNISFSKQIKIIGINGNAYIKGNEINIYNGTDIKSFIGLPLFPGTKIEVDQTQISTIGELPYINIEYYDGTNLGLDLREVSNYEIIDIGNQSKEILIRLNKKNDYYYATIKSFSENNIGTDSNQIVFSPQNEADENSPEINIESGIKIPVYQKQIFDLTPYIYEDSGIENIDKLYIDFDLTKDSDNDGNAKNDKDTDKINVIITNTKVQVEFGKYEELINKQIGLTIIDKNGNSGYTESKFQVYAPIPKIENYNEGLISGNINENLQGEPIGIYRYRSGILTKLESQSGKTKAFTVSGNYKFEVNKGGDGLKLTKNNSLIASINENTGLIKLNDLSSTINILSSNNISNDVVYPKIIVKKEQDELYYQYIKLDGKNKINLIDNFDNLTKDGLYLNFIDKSKYNYYIIPDGVNYNPGTLVIYRNVDDDKEPLFTIFTDGRVNTINENYSLEYFDYNGNIGYKLIDKHFNIEVAKLLLKINGEYIIK